MVDDEGKVLGVISEYDLLVRLGRHKETQDDGTGGGGGPSQFQLFCYVFFVRSTPTLI